MHRTWRYEAELDKFLELHVRDSDSDSDDDVYFTLATSNSRTGKYRTVVG